MTEISVLFNGQYWIALIKNYTNGIYSVASTIIGASEPTGAELAYFFDKLDYNSLKFTKGFKTEKDFCIKPSYKRRIRELRNKQTLSSMQHVYTKAHAMLKIQKSDEKTNLHNIIKAEKEQAKSIKFELRQLKKKEKLKGH